MNQYLQEAKEIEQEIIRMRRCAHQIPETGFDLPKTTAFIKEELEKLNIAYTEPCLGGIVAELGDGNGKTILIRADIDALPLAEESGLDFAADNGNAHACGHDAHIAMLLGAARMFKNHENEIHGTIRLVFQPDEEGVAPEDYCGAAWMIDHGVLEGVDVALGMHIWSGIYPSGTIAYRPGTCMSSCDDVILRVKGKGTHGGIPQDGIDPINIAVMLYQAMMELIARECDPSEQTALTFGMIHGGDAANIIPMEVTLTGTLRTVSEDTRAKLKSRITEASQGIAKAFGGECEVRFKNGIPSVYNDPEFTKQTIKAIEDMMGEPCFQEPLAMGISDDFCEYSHKVPSCYIGLGAGNSDEGYCYAHHHPKIRFNEDVMYKGSAIFVQAAMSFLSK